MSNFPYNIKIIYIYFFYLKEFGIYIHTHIERERENASMSWFIPQMPQWSGGGQVKLRIQESNLASHMKSRTTLLSHHLLSLGCALAGK